MPTAPRVTQPDSELAVDDTPAAHAPSVPGLQAAIALDVNLVWFAVLMAVNLNLAFISPPVGFSLFYLQSVAPPEVSTAEIHRGAIPFMGVQMIGLVVLTILPESVVYLVRASGLGNELSNSTDFMPGSFGVRLVFCILLVAGIGALWSWRLRRKYGRGTSGDDTAIDVPETDVV